LAKQLIAHAAALLPVLAIPAAAPAVAQIELNGTTNVPGRIFYHCRKYFGSESEAGGALDVIKDIAEDGTLLRMRVSWFSNISNNEKFGGDHGISPLFGAAKDGIVELAWPQRYGNTATRIDWDDPEANISMSGAHERYDRKRERKEPWRQVLVDRSNRLLLREYEGVRYIDQIGEIVMASSLLSPATPGFRVRLGDLAAWASGVDKVTVYETRVARRKFDSRSFPNSPGPNRVVLAYTIDPRSLVETARKVRRAIEQWEGSIADFKTECERFEEEDESRIILV